MTSLRPAVTCAVLVVLFAVVNAAPGRVRRYASLQWLQVGPLPSPEHKEHRTVEEFWVVQDLDHFNRSIDVQWKQRYFQNAEYYQPGGPVFVFISGNSEASPQWISSSFVSELAKQHNALLLELEHRFYGASQPTPNLSSESLEYLNVEQVLEDFLHFIWHINGVDSDLTAVKWVAFGGGYGGTIASWINGHFDLRFGGAVVSSAPMLAVPYYDEYLEIVGEAINVFDSECYNEINSATQEFEELLKSDEGLSKINEWFGLCEPLDVSKEHDIATLYSLIPSHFSILAQNNKLSVEQPSDLERECALLKSSEGDSSLQRISSYLGLQSAESCFDPSYEGMLAQYQSIEWDDNQSGLRQWLFQDCTEFGFWQVTLSSRFQPFGDRLSSPFFSDICLGLFGPEYDYLRLEKGIAHINKKYGGKNPSSFDIVYVYGGLDPWLELGALGQIATNVYSMKVENVSHCQDLKLPSDSDVPQLIAAREKVAQLIAERIN